MEDAERPASEKRRFFASRSAMPMIAGLALTTVASIAAAISAWASFLALDQSRETQLLDRRVQACFDLDHKAAEQIIAALEETRDWDVTYSDEWSDPCLGAEAESARCVMELARREQVAAAEALMHAPRQPCPGDERERAACEAERVRAEEARQAEARQNTIMNRQIASLRFESARTFALLGPSSLSDAEEDLSSALSQLTRAEDVEQAAQSANEALVQFRTACTRAVGAYAVATPD